MNYSMKRETKSHTRAHAHAQVACEGIFGDLSPLGSLVRRRETTEAAPVLNVVVVVDVLVESTEKMFLKFYET